MRDKFLVFGAPKIEQPEIDEVVASLQSGWLGTGPKVARFEQAFSAYKGAKHAAALNSCTSALHLSILAAGIGQDDEVITTPMTFCATVNAIIHAGATPVLADAPMKKEAPAKKDAAPKTDAKADAKTDAKADTKTAPKADAKTDAKADAKVDPKADTKTAPKKDDTKAAKPVDKK